MDEIITQLGHWLGEVYVTRGYKTTLALQLVAIAMAVTGAITARDYAKRRKKLKENQTGLLTTDSLSMTLLSDEGGTPAKYVATVTSEVDRYRLNIIKFSGASQETTISEYFQSLDEVEYFLKQNTQFLLSDFK